MSVFPERLYAAALASLPFLGHRSICTLVAHFGSAEAVWKQPADTLQQAVPLSEKACHSLQRYRSDYDWDRQLQQLSRHQTQLISLWDEDYPPALKLTYNPPVVLYYQGVLQDLTKSAAVVGARKATPYGRNVAQTLAENMAMHDIAVISGGARGIDAKAHTGALAQSGYTVAVVANGLDICYPPEHKGLFQEIVEKGGAVVSEYAFGMKPLAINFPARNRIIAGLGRCVVIVEAALRSGSLITADFALEEGRDVFSIPGSVYSEQSRGTNALLRKGAIPLTGIDDLLEEYGWNRSPAKKAPPKMMNLTLLETTVLDCLSCDEGRSREDITLQTQLLPAQIAPLLLRLQLLGLIEELPGSLYIKR